MKRFAILIGTEKYQEFNDTAYCHNDVDVFRNALTDLCDYAEQDVLFLKLDKNSEISPQNILQRIEGLLEKSEIGDTVLFFYAGHGDFYNGDSYLILPNTKSDSKEQTALPLRDVVNILSKNKRLNIRIFDTCHSGQDVRAVCKANSQEFTRSIMEQQQEGSITFASCKADEVSYGHPSLQNGVFTYHLVGAIKEHDAGQEIFPENLKLSLCSKVADWCEKEGLYQTPTYSSFVQGNVALAKRKQVPSKEPQEVLPTFSIEQRLEQVRHVKLIGGEEHMTILRDSISNAHSELEKKCAEKQFFGQRIDIENPMVCYEVPEYIKRKICGLFRDEKTLHKIAINKVYKTQPSSIFSATNAIFGKQKELVRTDYILEQDRDMPASTIIGMLASDGYLPSSGIILYLVPMQSVTCVICGHFFDSSFTRETSEVDLFITQKKYFTMDVLESAVTDTVITHLLEEFEAKLHSVMDKRLNYLEWEQSKATGQ